MTKQMMTMSAVAKNVSSEAKSEGGFPRIMIGVGQEFSSAENATAASLPINGAGAAVRPVRLSAVQAAAIAGKQLGELVRLPLDSISSVTRTETGWQVIVNLVELSRIPHSTDVISSYDITLGEDGMIEGYRRTARYTRDQLGDDL
jgi:hypothetical protein